MNVKSVNPEVFCAGANLLGEGPVWSVREQALYWLDIGAKQVHRQSPGDRKPDSRALPDYPGCFAMLASGNLAIALGSGIDRLDWATGKLTRLIDTPPRPPGTRFNDGGVDPQGRFWVSTMQNNFGPRGEAVALERHDGALYRCDSTGAVRTLEEGIGVPNTFAWSPDSKRFYFADSMRGPISVYDYAPDSGKISNKRVWFDAPNLGVPDGSAIDAEGCLWNARWGAGVVVRITPQGGVDRTIQFPVPQPTSCAFGGPRLDTLFVTSARIGLTDAQLAEAPLSGTVFAIHGLAQGTAIPSFSIQETLK